MRLAIFADLHANREAFDACMAHALANGAEGFALLGDYVGYGADPAYVVERVQALAADGALVVQGNHDRLAARASASREDDTMNPAASAAIVWTVIN